MGSPDFWAKREEAEVVIKRLGELQEIVRRFEEVEEGITALAGLFDEGLFYEVRKKFRNLELRELFKGKYDVQAAVISIYPGAGGDDAEDWAKMLFEMYRKYAERQGWGVKALDESLRSRTLEMRGTYAYGYLKRESGVHRLVRISPFSAKQLRHTSFALVEVVPDLPALDQSKFEIPEKDLRFEFSRSSGPGGQNVNKLETAVRVVHLPTNLAASSQAERSQGQNRERALSLLKAKLFNRMEAEQAKELGDLRTNVKPEWGNQIRSYVLNPYQLVKDHRTAVETSQVEKVLAGDIDIFIESDVELLSM